MRVRRILALMCGALALPSAAHAAQDSDTFEVTATVLASCNVTAEDLDFGDYDPISATPMTGSTDIEVTCTNGTPYDVALDEGVGAGGSIAERRMTRAGGATLSYTLYQDGSYADVWGDTLNTDTVDGVGTGAAQTLTIHGRAAAQQTAPAGSYTDTITVTVIY